MKTLGPPLRVVVPFVEGRLHASTREWADACGAELRDVGADRGAYFWLLRELWTAGESFVVVKQDVVPPLGAVRQLASCPEPWCGFPYAYGRADVRLEGHLGCTRFAAALVRQQPALVDESSRETSVLDAEGGDDYEYLSLRIAARLRRVGVRFHAHDGEAAHHHPPEEIWRQNVREFVELVDAMRGHRLAVDVARKIGDDAAALRSESLSREAAEMIVRVTRQVPLAELPEPFRRAIAEAVEAAETPTS